MKTARARRVSARQRPRSLWLGLALGVFAAVTIVSIASARAAHARAVLVSRAAHPEAPSPAGSRP